MMQIGLFVVALGIVGIAYGVLQRLKAGRVAEAPLVPTGEAGRRGAELASPKGALSAQGDVSCPEPLVAPVTGTPCLWFKVRCKAEWKEGDSNRSRDVLTDERAARFWLNDGSGPVAIDAQKGGDFEPTKKKTETKGTGLVGGITGADLVFGSVHIATGPFALGTKFTIEEEVLPVVPRLYACGKAEAGGIGAPSWRALLLDTRSRDELLAAATVGAKRFLIGGAVAFVLGGGIAAAGQLTARPTTTAAAASASAAPVASASAAALTAATATAATATTTAAPDDTGAPAAVPRTGSTSTTGYAPAKTATGATTAAAKGSAPSATAAPGARPAGAGSAPTAPAKPATSSTARPGAPHAPGH